MLWLLLSEYEESFVKFNVYLKGYEEIKCFVDRSAKLKYISRKKSLHLLCFMELIVNEAIYMYKILIFSFLLRFLALSYNRNVYVELFKEL